MSLRKISTALLLSLAGVLLVPTASASPVSSARVDHPRPAHRHGHRPAPKPKPKPAPQNAN